MLISDMATLGSLIREARMRKNWTTTTTAAKLGIGQSTLSNLERDKFVEAPEPRVLKAIEEHLGIKERDQLLALGYLQADQTPSSIAEARPIYDASDPHMGRALREIATWTPEQRDLLWRYIEAVSAALDRDDPPDEAVRDRRRVAP